MEKLGEMEVEEELGKMEKMEDMEVMDEKEDLEKMEQLEEMEQSCRIQHSHPLLSLGVLLLRSWVPALPTASTPCVHLEQLPASPPSSCSSRTPTVSTPWSRGSSPLTAALQPPPTHGTQHGAVSSRPHASSTLLARPGAGCR